MTDQRAALFAVADALEALAVAVRAVAGAPSDEPPAPTAPFELSRPVEDLRLPVRAHFAMRVLRLETVGDLVRCTAAELLSVTGFGQVTLDKVRDALEERGLHLAP